MAEDGILQPGAVALVTGASAGIGAATARALAARGVAVICASRNKARLDELVAELGAGAHAIELDVADAASAESLIARLPEGLRASTSWSPTPATTWAGAGASTKARSRTGPASSRPT